ncbi:hypothetical protein [Streptomyces sp. NPDC004284]|uniref:hypothetical protein n=1 Tax=Streptomyces sp. NPDC004284 TaxID=3364695 RepID=UPI00367CB4A1
MTTFQALPTTPAALVDLDPYRFPAVRIDDHREKPPTAPYDDALPAPGSSGRPPVPLTPPDRRRLELHAALTAAGIAPLPGDRDAVEALCTLDDTTHAVLRRWLGNDSRPTRTDPEGASHPTPWPPATRTACVPGAQGLSGETC